MSTAATQPAVTPQSIHATLCAELAPWGVAESMILELAAHAMYRLQLVSRELLAILEKDGYTGHYFRTQRSEAKDRASMTACLSQFHKMAARRMRLAGAKLDHAVKPSDPPQPARAEPATSQAQAANPQPVHPRSQSGHPPSPGQPETTSPAHRSASPTPNT